MGTVHGEFPLQPEISLLAGLRGGRDDRQKERAFSDLPADRRVPGIASAQFALVKPHLDAGSTQRLADSACSIRVLRGVAQEYGFGRVAHAGRMGSRLGLPE